MMTRILSLAAASALLSPTAAGAQTSPDRAAIVALRKANNDAIARRDLDGVMAMIAEDYVIVAGNDGIRRSRDEARARWEKDFASKEPVNRCVREPRTIQVGEVGAVMRAAESGRWRCDSTSPKGPAQASGAYFAHWTKRSGDWRVVSDNYVTLTCRGPGC